MRGLIGGFRGSAGGVGERFVMASMLDNQNHRAALALTLLHCTKHRTRIADHRLEAAGVEPTLCLFVDQLPRREFARTQKSRRSRSRHPAQRVEHLAQFVSALRHSFVHLGRIRGGKVRSSSKTSVGYGLHFVIPAGYQVQLNVPNARSNAKKRTEWGCRPLHRVNSRRHIAIVHCRETRCAFAGIANGTQLSGPNVVPAGQ